MTRRRFIQQPDGSLREVGLDYQPEPKNHDAVLWNDRSYQDCGDARFSSRSTHREYMKRHGLTTVDDFTETFERAKRSREAFHTSAPDSSRAHDIARALERMRG